MTLENIIEKIQKGENLKNELYERTEIFLNMQIGKFSEYAFAKGVERSELLSVAWLGMERAIQTYDLGSGCKFLTWAGVCIKSQLMHELKKYGNSCISLDEFVDDGQELRRHETTPDPQAEEDFLFAEAAIDDSITKKALKRLEKSQLEIVYLCFIKGVSLKGAAKKMGISLGRAKSLRLAAMRSLRNMM